MNIAENPAAVDTIRRLGYSSTPVVVVDDDTHWTGFRPSMIEKLAKLSD